MSQRIKLPPRDPDVRVELGEGSNIVEFKLKPITLEIEEQLEDLARRNREVEANPDSKVMDITVAEVAQLDVILEPVASPAGDRPRTVCTVPSEILIGQRGDPTAEPPVEERPGYVTGAVTRAQIQHTVQRITEAARPT